MLCVVCVCSMWYKCACIWCVLGYVWCVCVCAVCVRRVVYGVCVCGLQECVLAPVGTANTPYTLDGIWTMVVLQVPM